MPGHHGRAHAMASLGQLEQQLHDSLSDARLSDEEKRTLLNAIRQSSLPEEGLRRLRNQAFELARQRLDAEQHLPPAQLVRWLEGVMRVLDVARGDEVVQRACFSPGTACLSTIQGQLASARGSIDICVFTLSDDRISQAVLAAHQRGVQVRIITDNDKALDAGSDVAELRRAGIAVREDRTEAHMHNKYAVFDQRWLINGSYNWTRSASTHNEENLVLSNDPALVSAFSGSFERLWSRLA